MEIQLTIKKTFNAKTLNVYASPRYWEDSSVNGEEDTNGLLIPCRVGDMWCPIIDIDSGKIVNWEQGKTAEIHYKVCDNGMYELYDETDKLIKQIEGYVLDDLQIEDSGYGDYIIIEVNEDGFIKDWNPELNEFNDEED